MVQIRLRNTKTRKVEPLEPTVIPGKVGMYVCGPTVYDRAHLGNARPAVVFDVLNRLLRHVYGAGNVTYVRNITDVDDKINAEAQRRRAAGADGTLEELIADRADETIRWYHEDMAALGVLPPDREPRATGYIAPMIAMIEGLIAKGHAYEAEGHVLFRVKSYSDYGALSGRSVEDMLAGARVEVAPYKEDPMDFVLWKPSDDELPGWDSPWGRGRPGWHIECSAMAAELLGEAFDIHGGGIDLQFPHHENEIAQSACMGHAFARIWMHNEMLQVEGKKMSKSLGNFFTVRDLLDQGVPGEVIRFVMLSTHYSKPMDWTAKKRAEAESRLARWFRKTDGVEASDQVPAVVEAALADDLNTHLALTEMDKLGARPLKAAMRLLGFPEAEEVEWFRSRTVSLAGATPDQAVLKGLMERWQGLRAAKDFAAADDLKGRVEAAGVRLKAGAGGPEAELLPDFDAAKLEALK
ncbi:cysteine--tRNA ligase [Rhodobacterales bacterium HKCCE3408]|nr:cysteine--tRNA ligase [Rhodobacterales bacterium HKCCE3408]